MRGTDYKDNRYKTTQASTIKGYKQSIMMVQRKEKGHLEGVRRKSLSVSEWQEEEEELVNEAGGVRGPEEGCQYTAGG